MSDSQNSFWKNSKMHFIVGIVVLSGVGLAIYGYFSLSLTNSKAAELGQLDDYFGGLLNPFFGLITTVFAYMAYSNTKKQLDDHRDEIERNRYVHALESLYLELDIVEKNYIATLGNKKFYGKEALNCFYEILKSYVFDKNLYVKDRQEYDQIKVELMKIKMLIDSNMNTLNKKHRIFFGQKVSLTLPPTVLETLKLLAVLEESYLDNAALSAWMTSLIDARKTVYP